MRGERMSVRGVAVRLGLVLALSVNGLFLGAGPARALFHLMMVREVFAGTSTTPTAQFIELQMYEADQRFLAGHEVAVFDASGAEIAVFTFTNPVPNGANQSYVLLATEEAEAEFGVTADLVITPQIPASGGSVCFRSADGGVIDCASWGSYSGDDADTGTPFNSPVGLVPDRSMERVITGGSDPRALDARDDTNDSEADFDPAAPSPTSNTEESAPPPGSTEHDRSITLSLKRSLVARGRVSVDDEFAACIDEVPVKVQRKTPKRWRTVERTRTDSEGAYKTTLPDRAGRYRAVAPPTSPSDEDDCSKATSPTKRR